MKAEHAGFTVLLCPFCGEQVTNDPRKPRRRLTCPRCTSRFIAPPPEFAFDCAHCSVPLRVPRWIVGKDVRCPACRGVLRLRWEDEEEGRAVLRPRQVSGRTKTSKATVLPVLLHTRAV
jgi:DNA-directed RNA polymerase subunit RPC12/RpoP